LPYVLGPSPLLGGNGKETERKKRGVVLAGRTGKRRGMGEDGRQGGLGREQVRSGIGV